MKVASLRGLRVLLCLLAVVPFSSLRGAEPARAGSLPDFAGIWVIVDPPDSSPPGVPGTGPPASLRAALPRFRPEVARRFTGPPPPATAQGAARARDYCTPTRFIGDTGFVISPGATLMVGFEILATPGRLMMVNELGLVRRLYVRDTPPANALDISDSGTSIARWEGSTLVVRTTGLNPSARVIVGIPGTEIGAGAEVTERFTARGDELEITSTVTAPQLYAAPYTTTHRYRRAPGQELVMMVVCTEDDRSFDAVTQSERFDTTPPPDLPPPPAPPR